MSRKTIKGFIRCGLGLWMVAAAMGAVAAPVRLAIIAEDQRIASAADFLTAELSKKENIQLLERTEIEKVFREQGLSAQNKDYLKLGRVLGADGLLLLDTAREATNQILATRLVAVKPGVVLGVVRSPWPVADAVQWARGMAKHFEPDFPKLGVLAKDAVPLSVVGLRSALSTAPARSLEKELTLMLIHRLAVEREVFVLERQHLRELCFEQQFKPEEDSPFWTGRFLLDGVLDKEGFNRERLTINARLVSPQGGAPIAIEVAGPRDNPTALIETLAAKVLAGLKRTSGGAEWHPLAEAEQFYDEAEWAHRWGLLAEAEAASESAWALGKQTKEVAAFRIQAYSEDVFPDNDWGNWYIPAIPDPSKGGPAIRALELFCQDAGLAFTNNATPDATWYELGLRALRPASALLDGFYQAAELRSGNEALLADLRTLIRRVVAVLESHVPSKRISQNPRDLGLLSWEQGGLWYEKPEEALPLFRRTLESGYVPEHLPRVAGWSWPERRRVPGVVKQFVQDLRTATNPAVQLEGLYLALLGTPFDEEGHFREREAEMMRGLWEHRQLLYDDPARTKLLRRTEEALLKKYGYIFKQHFTQEPFASCKERVLKDYLGQASAWNSDVFGLLFHDPLDTCSPVQAQELVPLLKQYSERQGTQAVQDKWARAGIDSFTRQLEAYALTARPAKPATSMPEPLPASQEAESTLAVKLTGWKLKKAGIAPGHQGEVQQARIHGGRIWTMLRYRYPNRMPADLQTLFAGADARTGECEEIAFPSTLGFPDPWFEVTDDSLFTSVQNRIQRYRFRERTWESIPVPMEGGARILELGGRLYLATAESLLEVEPESREVQILASSRRRPAANDLDSAWGQDARISKRPDGRLRVVATNELFTFTPEGRGWERRPLLRGDERNMRLVESVFSEKGVQTLLSSAWSRQRLVATWDDEPETECLLERPGGNGEPPGTFAPPRWTWPSGFFLEHSCIVAEGKAVWLLTPRIVWHGYKFRAESLAFNDDRQATLLRFGPGSKEALGVPVRFEKEGQPKDPFEPGWGFMGIVSIFKPFWLDTSEGFIVISADEEGHWLIPKAALASRLKPPPPTSVGARPPGEQRSQAAGAGKGGSAGSTGATNSVGGHR